jgi:phenylpyruvate tautomerase PptA (4-oxalocrotonate tautomerase family)
MPVFINEVVFRGDVQRAQEPREAGASAAAPDPAMREALIAEVTQAVIDHLERELDRIGER